jgi:hypothetical protein
MERVSAHQVEKGRVNILTPRDTKVEKGFTDTDDRRWNLWALMESETTPREAILDLMLGCKGL